MEARPAFADAEQRARFLGDRVRRAAALKGLGLVALGSGYLQDAREFLAESIDLLAGIGDRSGRAAALLHLGAVYRAAGRADRALRHLRRAQGLFADIGHPEGVAAAHHGVGQVLREWGRTAHAVKELAAAAEEYRKLGLPEALQVLQDLGEALADSGAERAARLTLARSDRGVPAGPARRAHRIRSRLIRAGLARHAGDSDRAASLARRALRHSARTTGHGSRVAAHLAVADAALASGDLNEARVAAETALAFAREHEDLLAAAEGERILLVLAAREGRPDEVRERAHRAARAYTGRSDVADGPARLLLAYAEGAAPNRAERLLRRARSCHGRLEAQGYRGLQH